MRIELDKPPVPWTDSPDISIQHLGLLLRSTETYDVIDNHYLDPLTISKTVLHNGKSTSGHSHDDQEEIYIFLEGTGFIRIGDDDEHSTDFPAQAGDVFSILAGQSHRVINIEYLGTSDLTFYSIYPGRRHKYH